MPDPGVPVNCPYCGDPLTYQETVTDVHIYMCPRDGYLRLTPDGRVRAETFQETEQRLFGEQT